jgi:hypothetical protein
MFVQQEREVGSVVEHLNFVFDVAAAAVVVVVVVVVVVKEPQLFEMDLMVLEYPPVDSLVNHNKDDHVK